MEGAFMNVAGYGLDVSHHQQAIDWKLVAEKGIKSMNNVPVNFAILKCVYEAQSHRTDEFFERNYKGCKDNAITVGIYVYHASKSLADPVSEANAVVRALNGRPLNVGIWHDLEDKSLQAAGNKAIHNLLAVEDAIFRQAGYDDIGIYCNKYWYDKVLDTEYLKKIYKYFWIARYLKNDVGVLPSETMSPHKFAAAWQFSSKGKVWGINGNVDLDVDFIGLAAQMGFTSEAPKPTSGTTVSPGIHTVTVTNKLNVRKTPELGQNVIGQLPNGTMVNVTEISGKWAKIEGWVSTNYLK
jgi:GH25 family lysozyme M1 (1,4-beta-N-acetylmuramidase)